MKLSLFSKRSDDDDDFDDDALSDEEESPSFFASFFKKRADGENYEADEDGGDEGEDDEDSPKHGWLMLGGLLLGVGVVGATIGYFIVRDSGSNFKIVPPPPPDISAGTAGSTVAGMSMPPKLGPENLNEALLTPPGSKVSSGQPRVVGGQEANSSSDTPRGSLPSKPPTSRIEEPSGPVPGETGDAPPPSFATLPPLPKSEPLLPVQSPDLTMKGPYGQLPIVTAKGKNSINTYARPFKGDFSKPRVAIIITGLGLNRESSEAAIDRLPADVTLAFSPYATGVKTWIDRSRAAGHETLLELPMEPTGFPLQDPGPLALMTQLSPEENATRFEKVLGKGGAYVGVLATMGDKFLASPTQILPILISLQQRGLLYVDNGKASGGGALADGAPASFTFSIANLTLDEQPFASMIDARLAALVLEAQTKGRAVALASSYPVTLSRIIKWTATFQAKGLELAPVSAVAVTAAAYK